MSDRDIIDTIAQAIWQRHAAETGRSLDAGLADKLAASSLAALCERYAIVDMQWTKGGESRITKEADQ